MNTLAPYALTTVLRIDRWRHSVLAHDALGNAWVIDVNTYDALGAPCVAIRRGQANNGLVLGRTLTLRRDAIPSAIGIDWRECGWQEFIDRCVDVWYRQ